MIRVLIVDDHPVTSAGVAAALVDGGDIEITGVASDLESARRLVGTARPDVVLCDIQLGSERALGLPHELPDPAPPVLFFTSYDYPSYVRAALDGGAAGYLLKSAPIEDVLAAVRTVAGGGTAFAFRDLRTARQAPRMPSDRELEVIVLVAEGRSNAEIGASLGIDERTVESHLRRLFTRYDVDSRTALTMLGLRLGWIDLAGRAIP